MPVLRLAGLLVLAFTPGCHPAILGAAAASSGGGGGGGEGENLGAFAVDAVDRTWAPPGSSLNVTVTLGGSGGDRTLAFSLDPDGLEGPEPATNLTASTPLTQAPRSSKSHTVDIPDGTTFDSYRLIVEVSNSQGKLGTLQTECPVYVHPGDSRPATVNWVGEGFSTGAFDCRGFALLGNKDVAMVANCAGMVTTPLQQVMTTGAGTFYLARRRGSDGNVLAELFAMPLAGGRAVAQGVAVLGDDSVLVAGEMVGEVEFGTDGTNAPRRLSASRSSAFVARYEFVAGRAVVRNVALFESTATSGGNAIAALPTADAILVGRFSGTTQFGTPVTAGGDSDGMVLRLRNDLSVAWVARIGSSVSDGEECTAVAINAQSEVAVAGYVRGDVEVGSGDGSAPRQLTTTNGSRDMLAVTYDSSGRIRWAQRWGGPGPDDARSIVLSSIGVVFLGGDFFGQVSYVDHLGITHSITSQGSGRNACVVQYDGNGTLRWVSGLVCDGPSSLRSIAFIPGFVEELLVAGEFTGTLSSSSQGNPVSFGRIRAMSGAPDAFLANLSTAPGNNGRLRRLRGFGGQGRDAAMALLAPDSDTFYLGATLASQSVMCPPVAGFRLNQNPPGPNNAGCVVLSFANPK